MCVIVCVFHSPFSTLSAKDTWQQQDKWMEFYRQRFGPEDGYARPGPEGEGERARRSTQSSPGGDQYLVDYHSGRRGER